MGESIAIDLNKDGNSLQVKVNRLAENKPKKKS